jgi:hypothetical protein
VQPAPCWRTDGCPQVQVVGRRLVPSDPEGAYSNDMSAVTWPQGVMVNRILK